MSAKTLDDMVIRWEKEFDAYLGDIARRMADGTICDADAFPLVSLERTVMLYDLMMAGSIESIGRWACTETDFSEADALAHLVQRLHRATGKPAAKIRDALDWARKGGSLTFRRTNGEGAMALDRSAVITVDRIASLIAEVAACQKPYVDRICTGCPDPCCRRVHYLFTKIDLLFIQLAGKKRRWAVRDLFEHRLLVSRIRRVHARSGVPAHDLPPVYLPGPGRGNDAAGCPPAAGVERKIQADSEPAAPADGGMQ